MGYIFQERRSLHFACPMRGAWFGQQLQEGGCAIDLQGHYLYILATIKRQDSVKIVIAETRIWGYVLEGPGRPDVATQRQVLAISGVDLADGISYWRDTLPPRSTRPRSALPSREALSKAPTAGDLVVVSTLLVLGLSKEDVRWFVSEILDRGATVLVQDLGLTIDPTTELEDLLGRYDRSRSALYVRLSRARSREAGGRGR